MKPIETAIWIAIGTTFLRGLFVWDMGLSAADSYPPASAICLAGSLIAGAIMIHAGKRR